MASDHRDSETGRSSDPLTELWKAHKVALTLTGIGAAALLVAAVKKTSTYLMLLDTGDEPPIRVKGGSMNVELLSNIEKWEKDQKHPDKKHWKIWGVGHRGSNQLHVIIAVGPGAIVKNGPLDQNGSLLEVVYSDGNTVSFHSAGYHTMVDTSNYPLDDSGPPQVLTYDRGGTGFVKSISLDKNCIVECPNTGDFHELAILDC